MLKSICRIIALFALAMALVTAVLDITRSLADSTLVLTPLGLDWFNLSPSTLNLAQATVQRYVHPVIWDPVIQTVLLAPSWMVFGLLWFLFSLAGRQRRPRLQDRFGS
ncbi:MAG: hypothetical protein KDJ80_02135 [Nitratireductor sp.]|nr:hypothetical protein [Nitratireductor sp.]